MQPSSMPRDNVQFADDATADHAHLPASGPPAKRKPGWEATSARSFAAMRSSAQMSGEYSVFGPAGSLMSLTSVWGSGLGDVWAIGAFSTVVRYSLTQVFDISQSGGNSPLVPFVGRRHDAFGHTLRSVANRSFNRRQFSSSRWLFGKRCMRGRQACENAIYIQPPSVQLIRRCVGGAGTAWAVRNGCQLLPRVPLPQSARTLQAGVAIEPSGCSIFSGRDFQVMASGSWD